jgi:hypothetical protein
MSQHGNVTLAAARCRAVVVLAVALLSLAGCAGNDSKQQAQAAIDVFHGQLNRGDFDAIWNGADEAFRKAAGRDSYDKFLGAVYRKLGRALHTTTNSWSVNSFNLHTSMMLVQHTEFEHGSGTETFTFAVSGNGVTLLGYFIQSMELVTT